ncbi:hypothetical protein ACLIOK_003409, partial [Vibrio cholerae]
LSKSYYKTTEMIYKMILIFIGLHLKTEINEALVTNSKHHRSPYINELHAVSLHSKRSKG